MHHPGWEGSLMFSHGSTSASGASTSIMGTSMAESAGGRIRLLLPASLIERWSEHATIRLQAIKIEQYVLSSFKLHLPRRGSRKAILLLIDMT